PKERPKTVETFVALAEGKKEWTDSKIGQKVKKPLYDGTLFHRVIPGFMIQGGDPLTQGAGTSAAQPGRDGVDHRPVPGAPFGTGGPGFDYEDELQDGEHDFDKPCQLANANHGPNTNGSQFFLTEGAGDTVRQLYPRARGSL